MLKPVLRTIWRKVSVLWNCASRSAGVPSYREAPNVLLVGNDDPTSLFRAQVKRSLAAHPPEAVVALRLFDAPNSKQL
ncbi:hypothetical protein CPY51_30150 [Rhizobium tubonense]|uniref:Uncharacterized protein n=1 Tax=Rhizobium tubonense TaxID=484088 RepID=A0A2W4CRF6_9HYPH|nr:hypothetical protein CPY51_30150 [Rhizobium tubonense]